MQDLAKITQNQWIPRWFDAFSNPKGGFYERLDQHNASIDRPRRLLSQCRQIYVYALTNEARYLDKLDETFSFIQKHYYVPETGGSIFSIDTDNKPEDIRYDLYAHSFVILACAAYYQTSKNEHALAYAKTTLDFITNNFRLDIGFAEALDSNLKPITAIRRQNPHMHLLEACLLMYQISNDTAYHNIADEMVTLFFDKFFDEETGTLGEFFDDDLNPHPTEGHKIEAGHHAEWIWLLSQYQEISNQYYEPINITKTRLFDFVINNGIDQQYGGIYNVQDRQGNIIDSNKRIWTIFETYRACLIQQDQNSASLCLKIIKNHYLDSKTGWWHEILDQGLQPITGYRPATTPYHIYGALREIKD